MKSPREILFQRHQSVSPKLDTVRENALAKGAPMADRRGNETSSLSACLREIMVSWRWHLASLSAAWLLIALLNIDASAVPTQSLAGQNISSPRQLLAALRENRRQILELVDPSMSEPALRPSRRSEFAPSMVMA